MSPTKQRGLVFLGLNVCCHKYNKQLGKRLDMMLRVREICRHTQQSKEEKVMFWR